MLLPAGKTVGKGVKKVAEKVKSAVPKKLPKQPVGKMEGLGAAEDIGSKFKIEGPADNPYMYVPNKKDPNLGTWKPMFGYKDWMNHGYTDVPGFNKQIQDLKTLAVFGKRPVPTKVKAKMDPHETLTAAIDRLDNARFEEGLTDIIPINFYKGSTPYAGKQAFQKISPNKYGGDIETAQWGKIIKAGLRNQKVEDAVINIKNKIASQKADAYNMIKNLKAERPTPNRHLSGKRKLSEDEMEFIRKNPPADNSGYYDKLSDPNYLYDFKTYLAAPLEQRLAPYKKKNGGWLDYLD